MARFHLVSFAVLLLAIISCDTTRTIDPFEDEIGSFSVYGAIELGDDNNLIRIRDVSIPFLSDSSEGYDNIEVRLIEVETAREIGLRDTIINYNGNYTLNYIIEEDLQPRVAYDFSITDDLGEVVNSVFTMPGVTTMTKNQQTVLNCRLPITFTWDDVIAPEYILVEAGVMYQGQQYWAEIERVDEPDHLEGVNKMEMEVSVRDMLIDIFPPPIGGTGAIATPPTFWTPEVECNQLDNNNVEMRFIHFGPDWELFEETDYYIFDFVDSGEVDNGIGFLGGIRRGTFSFTVDEMN